MRRLPYILLFVALFSACISRPDNVLDEDQMTDVLIDVHMAEGLLDLQREESRNGERVSDDYQKEVIAAALMRHGITKVEYDSSLVWYSRNLKLLIRVYGRVADSLAARHDWWLAQATGIREFEISPAGDSVQLWTLRDYLILPAANPQNHRVWTIESDSNYLKGDTLRWQFATHNLAQRQLITSVALSLEKGDSTWQTASTIVARDDDEYQLTVAGDSTARITQVLLSAYLLPLNGLDTLQDRHSLLIDHISLCRYHKRP